MSPWGDQPTPLVPLCTYSAQLEHGYSSVQPSTQKCVFGRSLRTFGPLILHWQLLQVLLVVGISGMVDFLCLRCLYGCLTWVILTGNAIIIFNLGGPLPLSMSCYKSSQTPVTNRRRGAGAPASTF
jgi:hypothetical protein